MEYNVYFDFSSIFIYMLLIFSCIYRKMYKTKSGKFYLGLEIVCFATAVADILTVGIYVDVVTRFHFESVYLILRVMCAASLTAYMISVTNTMHILKKDKFLMFLNVIPALVTATAIIINLFSHGFTYDFVLADGTEGWYYTAGRYYITSGPGKYMIYGSAFAYLLFGACYVIHFRKLFPLDKLICLLFIFPITIVTTVVEIFLPYYLLEMLSVALASLFLVLTVERLEKMLDPESGLKKYSAFVEDSRQAEITKKRVSIIMIKELNFDSLKALLTYSDMVKIKKFFAKTMEDAFRERRIKGDLYTHGNGVYIATAEYTKFPEVVAVEVATELRERLNTVLDVTNTTAELFVNVGVFRCPDDVHTTQASINMIEAFCRKHQLNEVFVVSDQKYKENFSMLNEIDVILERGLKNNNYEVYYQPIYNFASKRFESAEALVRLKDPEYGFVSPALFIPFAEKNGLIYQIGDFVLEEVCKFIASDDFIRLGLKYIEVNLSVVQVCNEKIVRKILDLVNKYHVDPSKINLEITETADAFSSVVMKKNITRLKKCGFSFSLDDYGTGYSNIERILELPLSIVKIDKSFVDSMMHQRMNNVLKYTINMVKSLEVEIVVEGIETKEALDAFREYGCEYIQGFYFSKPLPLNEYMKFVEMSNNGENELIC